ncbi:unnamed protein product [Urochloa humidicola]
MDPSVARHLRRVRTLGRGASGAVVWLASDDATGQLLAVKSAAAAGGAAAQLRREERALAGLSSPHVVPCLGSRAAADGGHHLFLEFAPGGSLADAAARSAGGRLEEPAVRAYARDVARGLAYLHGRSLAHGDVKARNVVIGGDGRARLTDFGSARSSSSASGPVGGTPAFMAPEVARGEEQGPAADVWALACTVIEMATGAAPWSGDVDGVFAAVHMIGYTDAVPEPPAWLSAQGKDFLRACLARNPRGRPTAAQLLEHPFLAAAAAGGCDAEPAKHDYWPSPNSTLNAAFWEFDEDEEEEASERAAEKIRSLASPWSGFPDWDSEEGWIEVCSEFSLVSEASSATVTTGASSALTSEALDAAVVDLNVAVAEGAVRFPRCSVGVRDGSNKCQQRHSSSVSAGGSVGAFDDLVSCQSHSRVNVGSNVGIADGLVKCQRHPRVSVGSNVGIPDDVVKCQEHLREVSVGSNVEYLRPVVSHRGEIVELDCPCNREVQHKFNFVPIWPFC